MNHYDDLQRFQEKTRTQNLKFQDLSSQAATREHGDWAILNQLNPGAEKSSSLALGGSVSAPLPQSVPADLFRQVFTGGNAQFGRKHLDQHRHQVSPHNDPEELITKACASLNICGEVARIDITDSRDKCWPQQRQFHPAPCLSATVDTTVRYHHLLPNIAFAMFHAIKMRMIIKII